MNVDYSDKVKQVMAAPERDRIQSILEDVLGQSAKLVEAKWDAVEDARGRSLFTVQLKDWRGDAKTELEPAEVKSDHHLRFRLYQLWGDLLRAYNHKLLNTATRVES